MVRRAVVLDARVWHPTDPQDVTARAPEHVVVGAKVTVVTAAYRVKELAMDARVVAAHIQLGTVDVMIALIPVGQMLTVVVKTSPP